MSEILYEQYKDALRRGHVAALRGGLDIAEAAYREAAEIAPDRALPHVGLGAVLARDGRPKEALEAYAAALTRAPSDQVAMRGRADALAALGRRAEAATTLDRLAAFLEAEGRLADACDVARGALELAESRGRRRGVESLVARLRATGATDAAGAQAIERAVAVLEPAPAAGSAVPTATGTASAVESELAPDTVRDAEPEPPVAAPVDPAMLTLAVEEALEAGDLVEARRRALDAANGHRAVGQFHAAMDACYQALAILPSDPDIHLLLAELYLDRGWRGPAADKLVLLGRLAQLTGDAETTGRLRSLAAARFPDDARLAEVCA
jgi:tetratricopeptide (TPR) repeat protein